MYMQKTALTSIKETLQKNIGSNIEFICRSRRKESFHKGILDGAYQSLFTVSIVVDGQNQRLSYTYADILTQAVSIKAIS